MHPTPCKDAPSGAVVDGYWGFCGAVHPRPCRYVVVLRDPLVRARVAYEAYCRAHLASSSPGASAPPPEGYVAFAERLSNHYTHLFAHSGSGSSGRSRDTKRSSMNGGVSGSNSIVNSGGNNVTFATYQQALRHLRAHGVVVVFAHSSLPLLTSGSKGSALHGGGNDTTKDGVLNVNTAAEDRASVWAQLSKAMGDDQGIMQQPVLSHDSKGIEMFSSSSTFDKSVWCGVDVAAIAVADSVADASAADAASAPGMSAGISPSVAAKHTQGVCGVSLAERRAVRRLNRFDLKLVEQLRSDAAPGKEEAIATKTTATSTAATATTPVTGAVPPAKTLEVPLTATTTDSSSTTPSTPDTTPSADSGIPSSIAFGPKGSATVLPTPLNQAVTKKQRESPTLLHWWLLYARGHGSVHASSANGLSVFLAGGALTVILAGFALALLNALVQRCSARFVRRCNGKCRIGNCCCRCFGQRISDKDNQNKSAGKGNDDHGSNGSTATESDIKRRASAAKAAAFFADGAQGSAWVDVKEGNRPLVMGKTDDPLKQFLASAKLLSHEAAMRAAGYAEPLDLATATDEDLGGRSFDDFHNDDAMNSQLKLKPAELKRLRRALVKEGFGVTSGRAEGSIGVDSASRGEGGVRSMNTSSSGGSSTKNSVVSSELAYLKDREQFAAGSGWSSNITTDEDLSSVAGTSTSWSGGVWSGSSSSSGSGHGTSWAHEGLEDNVDRYGSAGTGLRGRGAPRGVSSFNQNSNSNSNSGNMHLNPSFGAGFEAIDPTSLSLQTVTGDPSLDKWISGSTSHSNNGSNGGNSISHRSGSNSNWHIEANDSNTAERRRGSVPVASAFSSTPVSTSSSGMASNMSNTRGNLRPFAPSSPLADSIQHRSPHSAPTNTAYPTQPGNDRHVRWNDDVGVRTIPHRSEDR